jgi:hypothetical protein
MEHCSIAMFQRTAVWGSLCYSEDTGSLFIWNVAVLIPDNTASQIAESSTQYCTHSLPWELRIWQYRCSSFLECLHYPHFIWNWNSVQVVDSTFKERKNLFQFVARMVFWHKCTQWESNLFTDVLTKRKSLNPVLQTFSCLVSRSRIMSASTASTDQLKTHPQPKSQ